MSNEVDWDGILEVDGEYYALDQNLPQNDNADGNGGSLQLSEALGAIGILVRCCDAITLADTKTLTITLYDSEDDSSFTLKAQVFEVVASGEKTYAAGEIMGRFVLPQGCAEYTKVNIATDDAAADGSVDILPEMMPR